MDVGGWLRSLGLDQYEANFRDNKIDVDVLADLTEGDLEELHVPRGDRRRLLRAIAALGAQEARSARSRLAPAALASAPQLDSAERRPITIMFCDLVGSTALATALDIEVWRNLLSAYLDAASEAVTQMGGRVAKKLGDGLMALFGHPIAQENDCERAVRAALAIQRTLAELNLKNAGSGRPNLVARIGVDCGAVVVDAAGEIFGDAPSIAARVQALAEPGAVLVTARVQRQTAGLFVAEDRGAYGLKGAPERTTLFRIVRASGARRFGARSLTPLAGRKEELDLLHRRWERALRGEGQLALVVGEPGIGKSRLVEEFRLRLGETPHTWAEFSSSQLLQNTPLHPIAEWGRQRFAADEPAARRLADLENTLRLIGLDHAEYAPLLAPLVDIPLPAERASKLAPQELRRRQLAAVTAWVLASARSQPVVQAFEDLHWADPSTLDLMQALAERGGQARLLILATARPEFRPSWSLRSHHSVISLGPLDRAEVAQMVGELAQRRALSEEMIDGVNERTGGVPLFVEEVTRLLLENGEQVGAHAIPPTLQQSLAARLDRLGEAREAAQIAAVLGRDFTYTLLRAVGGVDDPALQSTLDRLADAGLLIAEGLPPANYRFKHALIQDAAYDSLLKSRRQALHRRAGEILLGQKDDAGTAPEILARHFTEGGLDELAVEWWGRAGDEALRRSAYQEAMAHLGKAIAMAEKEASGAAEEDRSDLTGSGHQDRNASRRKRQIHLHLSYGNALIAARGHGAVETTAAFARARELASGLADPLEQLSIYYGLFAGSFVRGGETTTMREASLAALELAERHPHGGEAAMAHRMHGLSCWFEGDFVSARRHLEQSLVLFDPERDRDFGSRFGQDLGVAAMNYLAFALWPLGEIERARELQVAAIARARETGHLHTVAYAVAYRAIFEIMRSDAPEAEPFATETLEIGQAQDLRLYVGYGTIESGWVHAWLRNREQGAALMREGLDSLRQQGFALLTPLLYTRFAELQAELGEVDAALATLDQTLAEVERSGHRSFDAEVHRFRGEILLKSDHSNATAAEAALQTAVSIARQQAAPTFVLRAALSLARLRQATGRCADARTVLAPALEGFTLSASMPEIAEAQALMERLA